MASSSLLCPLWELLQAEQGDFATELLLLFSSIFMETSGSISLGGFSIGLMTFGGGLLCLREDVILVDLSNLFGLTSSSIMSSPTIILCILIIGIFNLCIMFYLCY